MAMRYAPHDIELTTVGLTINIVAAMGPPPEEQQPNCPPLRRIVIGDRSRLVRPARPGVEGVNIEFQFPPKVTDDSQDGDWNEEEYGPAAGDKAAWFKNANPRRMTVEWTYIVAEERCQ